MAALVTEDSNHGGDKLSPDSSPHLLPNFEPKGGTKMLHVCGADDMSVDSKKQLVTEKLRRREEERALAAQQRRANQDEERLNIETADSFREQFSSIKIKVEEGLEAVGSILDESSLTNHLNELVLLVQRMQKYLTDSTHFLSSRVIHSAQESINRLTDLIELRRKASAPKKKFAFKGGKKKSTAVDDQTDSSKPSSVLPQNYHSSSIGLDVCGFQDRCDEILTLSSSDLSGKRVTISSLHRCTVRLHGSVLALHANNLTDCHVSCGPVAGSAFISDCSNCQISVACQQLRVHKSHATSFYLHVTSRAIIEDCTEITTAPYTVSYDGLVEQMKTAGLDPMRNSWDDLDDFYWLSKDEPSPNWSILPVSKRIVWSQ